ncbi:MAG: hypothetical protein WC401_08250 [Bacteroidales bacterium]
MTGFFLMVDFNSSDKIPFEYPQTSGELINNSLKVDESFLSHYVLNKFTNDKIWFSNERYVIAMDGVVFNFKELKNKYSISDNANLLILLFEKYGISFVNELRGEFCGVLYSKVTKTWHVFTNHTGSKWVYYYYNQNNSLFIASTQVKKIVDCLSNNNIQYSLDEISAYSLITFGYMINDGTLISEIKKINPGTILVVNKSAIRSKRYYELDNTPKYSNIPSICAELHERFNYAISQEFEKDDEYRYAHLGTISGGLDSKTVIWYACQNNYRSLLINISESGLNETIARKMARDMKLELVFYALDNGVYLCNTIDDTLKISDGNIVYSGIAQTYNSMKRLDVKSLGLLHTGQIGDAVLGSFLKTKAHVKPSIEGIKNYSYSKTLLNKLTPYLQNHVISNFENDEILGFYTRAFNGAYGGYRAIERFTDYSSPFMHIDYLDYALQISPNLRYKRKIYLEWLKHHASVVYHYPWTSKAGLPAYYPDVFSKAIKGMKLIKSKIFGISRTYSMTPFDYWWKKNETVRNFFNDKFQSSFMLLENHKELYQDCRNLFVNGNLNEKASILTLLEAIKYHYLIR